MLNISQVLAALQDEFPDLKPSRIRYYDDKGLIAPQRSDSGYRKFTEEDVTRLRSILRMQRDRFLPLDVIAERLDGPGEAGPEGPPPGPELADLLDEEAPNRFLHRQELVHAAGVEPRFVTDLENFGLIAPDERGRFRGDTVAIVRACATLIGYGLEPRHLRPFKTAVDREVDLLEQVLSPIRVRNARRPDGEGAQELQEIEQAMAHAALQLHVSLFGATRK